MARALDPFLEASTLDAALGTELDAWRQAGLHRSLRRIEERSGATVTVDGRTVVDFASNDYLGLAADPRVTARVADVIRAGAIGAGASRNISGTQAAHENLERALARFKGAEAALLFSSGFAANAGVLPALGGVGDALYSDQLNHASIIDGCRLSRATVRRFPHRDLDVLRGQLEADHGRFRRKIIVIEGVFSMEGDVFPLDALVPLARAHDAWIYLDDAHGTGVLGTEGRGTAEHLGVTDAIDVGMGTLGKALGSAGAFITGSAVLRDYLVNRARSFIFSTATSPALAAAGLEALAAVESEPWRRERLLSNGSRLKGGLESLGALASASLPGHILPVPVPGTSRVMEVGRRLFERGFLVGSVRAPTVAPGGERLRIAVSALHTEQQIDGLLDALELIHGQVS